MYRPNSNSDPIHYLETITYSVIAAVMAWFIFYIHSTDPVFYTRLITEDNLGENTTFVAFAMADIMLIALLFTRGPRLRKALWAIVGLGALVIAGEEISWGQRFFHFSVPEAFRKANYQEEFNIHNLETMLGAPQDKIGLCLILGTLLFSAVFLALRRLLKHRFKGPGLELIPIRLFPFFLLAAYFFYSKPVCKTDEIREALLGIATLTWAFDQFLCHGWFKRPTGLRAAGTMTGMLLLVMAISAGMTSICPNCGMRRLNHMAKCDYPERKMYDQALKIYEYIYAHPEKYLKHYTRIYHGKLLLQLGRDDEAFHVLSKAAGQLESMEPPESKGAEYHRGMGTIYRLLGHRDRAESEFDLAIEICERQLDSVSRLEGKAQLIWLIAQILADRGDLEAALEMAKQAETMSTSAKLALKINNWRKKSVIN